MGSGHTKAQRLRFRRVWNPRRSSVGARADERRNARREKHQSWAPIKHAASCKLIFAISDRFLTLAFHLSCSSKSLTRFRRKPRTIIEFTLLRFTQNWLKRISRVFLRRSDRLCFASWLRDHRPPVTRVTVSSNTPQIRPHLNLSQVWIFLILVDSFYALDVRSLHPTLLSVQLSTVLCQQPLPLP